MLQAFFAEFQADGFFSGGSLARSPLIFKNYFLAAGRPRRILFQTNLYHSLEHGDIDMFQDQHIQIVHHIGIWTTDYDLGIQ